MTPLTRSAKGDRRIIAFIEGTCAFGIDAEVFGIGTKFEQRYGVEQWISVLF